MKSPRPTESELAILQVLWTNGPSTVRQINEVLCKVREVGYTTTLKLMQIMHEKGYLDRTKSGKTHTYSTLVEQSDTQQALLNRFVDRTFGGSMTKLVLQALGGHKADPAEIDKIRAYLDELENDQPS